MSLDEIQWKSPEFIQQRGLHTGNVLEYFALSPFYDRTSNNQVLTMQFQFQQIQIPLGMSFQQFFQLKLQEMTGTEFIIAFNREPDFWIVRKQQRLDTNFARTLQDYYIIGANVYQAPKIYDVLSSRLLSSVLSIKNSIDLLNDMTKFHILDGGHFYTNTLHNLSTMGQLTQQPLAQNKSVSLTVNNTGTANTVTPITMQSPQTVSATGIGTTGGSATNNLSNSESGGNSEISAAFDSLLNNVVRNDKNGALNTGASALNLTETATENNSIYLDDIPLYGKGSTVEMLGIKVNLEED